MKDFGPSWRDGVAFQSVVHAIRPDLVDMEVVRRRCNRENLEEAFALAENELGIPRLLDPEGANSFEFCLCFRQLANTKVLTTLMKLCYFVRLPLCMSDLTKCVLKR